MKAKDVMKLLGICRTTLYLYHRDGKIKSTRLNNGCLDYDEQSVFALLKHTKNQRVDVAYARVSTNKQKNDLARQIKKILTYCQNNDVVIDSVYSDISSGLDLDRNKFNELLEAVIKRSVRTVYITNMDRLTRLSFRTVKQLFSKFGTEIVIINDAKSKSNDDEIFEELISLMHSFSTTLYSKRRKNKLNIYKQDIENFIQQQ